MRPIHRIHTILALFAALLLWPLVELLRGKIAVGGLYLTSAGVEYRHEHSRTPKRSPHCDLTTT